MELSCAGSTSSSRSTRASKTSDNMTELTKKPEKTHQDEAGEEEGEDEEEVDELVDELYEISSSGSEKLNDPTYEDPANVSEESSTSEEGPLSQWPKGTSFPAFNFARVGFTSAYIDSDGLPTFLAQLSRISYAWVISEYTALRTMLTAS